MDTDFTTIKDRIKNALGKCYGVTGEQAEEMIVESDRLDEFELMMMEEFEEEYPPYVGSEVYGLQVGKHMFDFTLNTDCGDSDKNIAILFFGHCTDVDKAQKAMEAYDNSPFGEVLPIENCVEAEGDLFTLSYLFDAASPDEFEDKIVELFNILKSEKLIALLDDVLTFFTESEE